MDRWALLVLVLQIVTGIFLTMHYKPDAELAFASVEYIMRDVNWGWLVRYMHSTGASAFFVIVYLHMLRGLMYGSFKEPRELIWIFGMLIYLCLMAEAFMGYLLPWGQMSYWGAQVIVNLFGTIPVIGAELSLWIRGDYVVSDATLNRFFALHVIAVPIVLLGLVVAHIARFAHGRFKQPGWRRNQEKQRCQWRSARWHSISSLLHGQGYRRRNRVFVYIFAGGFLCPGNGRLLFGTRQF